AVVTNARARPTFIAPPAGGILFPADIVSDSRTLVGATAGLGLEYAFSNNWSLGVEGRYSWYGTHTYNAGTLATISTAGAFTFAPATQTVRVETLEVTGRLNYKFDWGG